MAKVADLKPILLDKQDKITMDGQLDACEERLAEMKTELAGYWAKNEAMELMIMGLRKILKG